MSKLVQSKRTDNFIYLKNIFLKENVDESYASTYLSIHPPFFSAVTVSRESSSTISLKKLTRGDCTLSSYLLLGPTCTFDVLGSGLFCNARAKSSFL